MNKLLLSLGTGLAAISPMMTVVACGSTTSKIVPGEEEREYYLNTGYAELTEYEKNILARGDMDAFTGTGQHFPGTAEMDHTRTYIQNRVGGTFWEHDFSYEHLSSKSGGIGRLSALETNDNFWASASTTNFSDSYVGPYTYADWKTHFDSLDISLKTESKYIVNGINGKNLLSTVNAKTDAANKPTIMIGAHYDHNVLLKGTSGIGTNDNNSGVAGVISLSRYFAEKQSEDYNVTFAFWDAEESGLNGSHEFVTDLNKDELANSTLKGADVEMYFNFDSIAGGDYLYFGHGNGQDNSKTIYEKIMKSKNNLGGNLIKEPDYKEKTNWEADYETKGDFSTENVYALGEAHPASDHSSFVTGGIKSMGIEATNYDVFGSYGRDGYSQTANHNFWYKSDELNDKDKRSQDNIIGGIMGISGVNSSGDKRADLENDGRIWHTKLDNAFELERLFPGRLEWQLNTVVSFIAQIVESYNDFK